VGTRALLLLFSLFPLLAWGQQKASSPGNRADSVRKAKEYFINGTTLLLQNGREAEAILEFQQSLRFDTTSTCLSAIARCYAQLRKLDLAHEYVSLALNRNAASRDAWELLAEIEVQRGHYDDGLAAYEEILKLQPTDRHIATLARLYEPRDAKRAIALYEQLIERKLEIGILGRLSELYGRLQDQAGMIRTLTRAVRIQPGNAQLSAELVELYVQQGMFDELHDALRRWNDSDPDMQGAARVWAVALSAMLEDSLVSGMYPDRVSDVLDSAFSMHSSSWPVMLISAALAGRQTDTIRSIRYMNAAIATPFAVVETYLEVVRLSLLQRMPSRAMTYVERGRAVFPLDVRLLFAKASIHVELGADSLALLTYEEIVRQSPLMVDAWAQLGWLHDRHGRVDSSDMCYEQALTIDPRNPFVCNNYAYSLCLRDRDLLRALQLSATSLESEPTNPAYLDTYAWILFRLKRYAEAETAARQAIVYGGNATHYEHLGDILEARGDVAGAVEAWQASRERDPGRQHLMFKIDRYK
jgi:tetratricopeptide (TPR) repeat protein